LGPLFLVLKPFTPEGYRGFMKPGTLHLPSSRRQGFSLPGTRCWVPGVPMTPTPKYPYPACWVGVFRGWGRGSLSQPQSYPCQSLILLVGKGSTLLELQPWLRTIWLSCYGQTITALSSFLFFPLLQVLSISLIEASSLSMSSFLSLSSILVDHISHCIVRFSLVFIRIIST
jgi:hypothetical protein